MADSFSKLCFLLNIFMKLCPAIPDMPLVMVPKRAENYSQCFDEFALVGVRKQFDNLLNICGFFFLILEVDTTRYLSIRV